jgi:hypothetical protein
MNYFANKEDTQLIISYFKQALAVKQDAASLARIATSGSYADLDNKPSIPPATIVDGTISATSSNPLSNAATYAELFKKANDADLATVAKSGKYSDLAELPTIPEPVTIDSTLTAAGINPVQGKAIYTELTKKANDASLSAVAKSGKYSDLSGLPTIPAAVTVDSDLDANSANPVQNKSVKTALDLKANDADLATVAKSGKYSDLSGLPAIPAAVTIDTALSATSANPVQNKAVKAALDTKADSTVLSAVAKSGSYADLSNKPTIPAAVTVDTALSTTSANPVQNKTVTTALNTKASTESPTFTGTPFMPTAATGTNNTQAANTAFVTNAIKAAIAGVTSISYQVVTALPSTGAKGVIYLLANGEKGKNSYDEYLWIGSAFEKFGPRDIDLSGYLKNTDLIPITDDEINAMLTAGTGGDSSSDIKYLDDDGLKNLITELKAYTDQRFSAVSGSTGPLVGYPVGAIYTSVDKTSPASLFGGTWQQIKDVFLLAAGDTYAAGSTGGSATVTLTESNIPTMGVRFNGYRDVDANFDGNTTQARARSVYPDSPTDYAGTVGGGGNPVKTMPPYLAIYIWKRLS